jgi:hypothetical protein
MGEMGRKRREGRDGKGETRRKRRGTGSKISDWRIPDPTSGGKIRSFSGAY